MAFDIVDTWLGCTVGAALNGYEAESGRLARFQDTGHTPGVTAVPPEERNPEFPLTLDLRRIR
jgi:uncharacterized protein (DUF2126 family)